MSDAAKTTEVEWLGSARLTTAPTFELAEDAHVVVVAPHPDDEILALGGTLMHLGRHGRRVAICAVTDGEGSHPRSSTMAPGELARVRVHERHEALLRLGLTRARVTRLRFPDGGVEAHVPALAERLAAVMTADTVYVNGGGGWR